MRYYVLYPKAENVHLIKDVGMIAYKLHKLYGYNSYIASYNNDKYYYLDEEVKGIKMDFIQKKNKNLINIFKYLSENSKNIDVLQIFHMTFNSVVYALLYKFFNRRGIIFLKLDCTELILQKIKNMKSIERIFFNFFLSSVDIIGVEQEYIFDRLKYLIGKHSNKLINVPNGIDFEADYFKKDINFKDKENIILNVGRIGSSEKATDLLMKAFSLIDEEIRKEWKLVFVGPVEDSFKETIEDFFEKYPNIKADIIFKGPIFNREELFQEYKKSKIFCLTSAYESFGIALIEAIACGNVIVSTRVGIAEEIVKEGKGAVVNVGDYKAIAVELKKLMTSDNLDKYSEEMKKYCKKQYNWDNIVENLHYRINNIRGKR